MGISVINLQSKSSFRFHQFFQNNDEFSIFIKTLHFVKSLLMIYREGGTTLINEMDLDDA